MDDYGSEKTILRKSKTRIEHILQIKSLIATTKVNPSPKIGLLIQFRANIG